MLTLLTEALNQSIILLFSKRYIQAEIVIVKVSNNYYWYTRDKSVLEIKNVKETVGKMGTGVFWYLGDVQGAVEFFTEINTIMGPRAKACLGGGLKCAMAVCQAVISVAAEAMLLSVAWIEDVQRGSAESCRNPLYLMEKLVQYSKDDYPWQEDFSLKPFLLSPIPHPAHNEAGEHEHMGTGTEPWSHQDLSHTKTSESLIFLKHSRSLECLPKHSVWMPVLNCSLSSWCPQKF